MTRQNMCVNYVIGKPDWATAVVYEYRKLPNYNVVGVGGADGEVVHGGGVVVVGGVGDLCGFSAGDGAQLVAGF